MQGLPPGFVLDGQPSQAPAPAPSAPGIIRGRPAPPAIPSGYETDGRGGLRPIPGGPADKPESDPNGPKLPTGYMWKDGVVGGEAVLIKGVPPPKGGTSGSLDPKTTEGQSNIAKNVLAAAGVTGDKDPVAELIQGSTSGTLQRLGADAYGAITGQATDGMENIGKLQTIANDMVLQMSGGSLGAQISDGDRKFIAARMGDIGNPDLPANQRIAAWEQVKERLFTLSGVSAEPELIEVDVLSELKKKYPDAVDFQYGKNNELLGYYDANGEFVLLYGPQGPQGPNDPNGGGLGNALYAGIGDVAEGVGDVLGLVGNPLNAGINALTGTNLSTDLGQTFRDATGAPEGNPLASAITTGGITALSGAGAANLARPIATGVGRTVANALSQEPIRQGVAGASAGASSELARQAGANPLLQAAAGLAGGVGGYGAAGVPQALMQPRQANPLLQAAQRQGVDLMPADVGGPATQRLSSAAAQGAISAPPVTRAAQTSQAQFGQATQRATGGSRLAPDDAGAIVRSAGERFTKESRAKGGALYNRAENMAKGVRIKARGAIQAIDEQIAQLQEGGEVNAPLIGELTKFRNSLANNEGIRIGGMRDIRTGAQKAAYSDDLRATPAQRVFGIVADAISQDIDAGLAQAGRSNAAQAFKTADAYWRDRVQYIDNVLEPIIGNGKSGEAVLRSVEDMAKGKGKGVQTLMKLMRSVDKEELSDIQATIIDRLGRSSAGQQNAEGDAYSAAQFLTRWNEMSSKGKAALFPDQNVRRNLDELAMIADSMKQSSRFANSSNTAGGIAGQVMLTGGLGMISPTALLLGSGLQYLSGRALASPRLTRWLATMPKSPQAQQAHIKRLGAIASAEPIIANDIASIQRFLSNAPGSARAAATEGQQEREERPIKP